MGASMIRFLSAAIFALGLVPTCAVAQTAVQRTFVSTSGSDGNVSSSCPAVAPCRSFGTALTVTKSGGEIVPLTSGGYGAVTISQSVQIATPPGVYAAITALTGNGITISAAATDIVVLKGLSIDGLGTGTRGISASTFGVLYIEHCTTSNFTDSGVSADISGSGTMYVQNSTSRNNQNAGFSFGSSSGLLNVAVENSRSEKNGGYGFAAIRGSITTISGTTSFRNTVGFGAIGSAELNCDTCVASGNALQGIIALATSSSFGIARVVRSTATNNKFGFVQTTSGAATSVFESLAGTNFVRGNTTNTSGTITPVTSP